MKKILLSSFYLALFIMAISMVYVFTTPEKSHSFSETKMADSAGNAQYQKDVLAEHQKLVYKRLAAELNQMRESSQASLLLLEHSIQTYGSYSQQVKNLSEVKSAQDSVNLAKVEQIIDKYGWLGPDQVGAQNSFTLFTTIQCADFKTQEKYIPAMEKAVRSGTLAPEHFARLVDRKALVQHRQQVFGTIVTDSLQAGRYSFAPILDEPLVNQRRAEIGLAPLEEYAKIYHIDYTPL